MAAVAGFTFIRNAVQFDYPVVESIQSVLPLVDYFVVAVGQSDDDTLALVERINDPKIHILPTIWDDSLREGGRVLAVETDKAFQAIPAEYDWCIYIQADECLHEQDYPTIRSSMERWKNDPQTEGLLFKYRHFYGSYDYIGASRRWYRREIRIIRNNKSIVSYRDAQGFRWENRQKLRVRLIDAWVYHYGWVKSPDAQKRKQLNFNKLWHSDNWVSQHVDTLNVYDYNGAEPLERFTGAHPQAMQARVKAINWQFHSDPSMVRWSWKDRFTRICERYLAWRPGEYRNYRLL
ncbi:MAG: glycosyltransferase family 2 protein [Bacteroidetes bacterium]|nr:glycosyltransferase family 2 protein [Bacteroidota bacterium]